MFVDHHIKQLANKHPSFLQDTPDFLRNIKGINDKGKLPKNSILVTVDVSSLYTNIPHVEGVECVRKVLDKRSDKAVPTGFIIRLLELVLEYNIF